jgi:hypothetical protein
MRTAAAIYTASALALLAVAAEQTLKRGIDVGIALTLLVVGALIVQAVALFRRNWRFRKSAMLSSVVIAFCFAAIVVIVLWHSIPLGLNDATSLQVLWLVFAVGSVSFGHVVAAISLAKAAPSAP